MTAAFDRSFLPWRLASLAFALVVLRRNARAFADFQRHEGIAPCAIPFAEDV
jgi:hypothetical protein